MEGEFPYAVFDVRFDPYLDRDQISKKILKSEFGVVDKADNNSYFNLLNVKKRLIIKNKRHLHISKKLVCPPEVKDGLDNFIKKVNSGGDINPHLSKRVFNTKLNDGMLLDFGLHHFHLGEELILDKSGNQFVTRTGYLLVAVVRDNDIYCLGIFNHSSDLWLNDGLIELIHNEWPHVLERYRIKNVTNIYPDPDSIDRSDHRKNSFNTVVKVSDGTYYQILGGGFNAAGSSMLAGFELANNNRTASFIEHYGFRNIVSIILNTSFITDRGSINLRLLNIPRNSSNIILHENTGDLYIINFENLNISGIQLRFFPGYAVYQSHFCLTSISSLIIPTMACCKNTALSSLFIFPPSMLQRPL